MDPVIAPFDLFFLGSLGLDLGLFTKDDTPEDQRQPTPQQICRSTHLTQANIPKL